jgi:nitrile hydratase
MNGVHDLGGLDGLGPVNPSTDEPVFHSQWERTVFGMAFPALFAGINLDEFRSYIERMHPVDYLSSRYYEHWLHAMERGLVDRGVISAAELEERTRRYREDPAAPLPEREDPAAVKLILDVLHGGASAKRASSAAPLFISGDHVRVRDVHPRGHTRAARYLRGKPGTVHRVHDPFVFPDSNARGDGENPQYVYSVCFEAADLWGDETSGPRESVYVDLSEPYLEAV